MNEVHLTGMNDIGVYRTKTGVNSSPFQSFPVFSLSVWVGLFTGNDWNTGRNEGNVNNNRGVSGP